MFILSSFFVNKRYGVWRQIKKIDGAFEEKGGNPRDVFAVLSTLAAPGVTFSEEKKQQQQ